MIQEAYNLKKNNTFNIYESFLRENELTKQDIVNNLGLTLPTITKNIDYLLENGLIAPSGSRGQTGGRSAVTYSIVADARIALGLDITTHHVSFVAVDIKGNIISFTRQWLPFEHTDGYFKKISSLLKSFIRKNELDKSKILGVGIGVPALVREDNKSIFYSRIIEELTADSYELFDKYIPYDVRLFNDAKAAVFAERWDNPYMKNVFYLLLSNNVGGAMMTNGKVYSGNYFKSAEVGHMTLVPRGKKCYCGQLGCVDGYLAATNLSSDDLEGFFRKLSSGDAECVKQWVEYLDYLAVTLRNVHLLLDCDIIIGGYIGAYIEPYITELRRRAMKLNTFETSADYIKLCSYKNESIAAGAALHFISDFIYSI